MLDVIVLVAMAVTAAAFAVGLILHSGIAQIPALIAAAALYMVMAASYLMVARGSRPPAGGSDRLNELEAALEMIDKDLQRIDRVEDDVSRLDLLADRVERLDQAMGGSGVSERAGGPARFEQFAEEFDQVHAKIENSARRSRRRVAQSAREDDRRSQSFGKPDQAAVPRIDRRLPRRRPRCPSAPRCRPRQAWPRSK